MNALYVAMEAGHKEIAALIYAQTTKSPSSDRNLMSSSSGERQNNGGSFENVTSPASANGNVCIIPLCIVYGLQQFSILTC